MDQVTKRLEFDKAMRMIAALEVCQCAVTSRDCNTKCPYVAESVEGIACHEKLMQDTHGRPEDSFGDIADLWTAYLDIGREITPVDVAQMMILLKIGRAKENPKHQDNWVDMAGYAACAGEIAAEIYGN